MTNERITENLVRNHFKDDTIFKSVKFEEQKSYNKRGIDLLQNASLFYNTSRQRFSIVSAFANKQVN